ncbi:AAA family ATPase [Thauera sp. SDU_THAU2]|uniref:AAA family ATPase n=1 Tax=Thauera sp. SDU_THAU2 TaxID=3136633 RepID=UPI004054B424
MGYRKFLPVLGQIWWARNRTVSRNSRTPLALLAIEQPELHLHPAHQALLADALVGEAPLHHHIRSPHRPECVSI